MEIPEVNKKNRRRIFRTVHEKLVEFPRVLVFDLGISINKGKVSTLSRDSRNLLEDHEGKSEKLEIFGIMSGKSLGRKILSMQFFNFNKKNHMHTEMCAVELW